MLWCGILRTPLRAAASTGLPDEVSPQKPFTLWPISFGFLYHKLI
jgi:hypothetical protein